MPEKYLSIATTGEQRLKGTIIASAGVADANKIPSTGSDGYLAESLLPAEILLRHSTNARLRSNAGTVEIRNAADTSFANLEAGDITVENLTNYGVTYFNSALNKYTISNTAPTSPTQGDRWLEMGTYAKYGFEWSWSGSYWLSPEQFTEFEVRGLANPDNLYFVADSAFDYFFTDFISASYVGSPNNSTNYWGYTLTRATATATTTIQTFTNTSAATAGQWYRPNRQAIATHVNLISTSTLVFGLSFTKTLTPGALYSAAKLIYRYARK